MTKTRRDLVSKGALAMVVAFGIACRGEGVAENTGGGAAVEVTTQALTAVDIDRVLGFEAATVSDWSIIQSGPGTLSVSTTASQGSRSLAVASHGYVPVQSVALPSLGSRVGSVIHYDIMLPSQLKQVSPTNYGATQLYLNSPSLGLNNAYLGQVELTPLPLGQWNTVTFTPTSSVLTKLRGTYTDLRVTIVVNAPYNVTQPYLLDNLRFSDSTLALVTVVDGGGHPISGLTVVAYNGSTPTSNTGVTDSTGLAKVWVSPGSYRFGVTEAGVTTYSSPTNQCQVPGICLAATIVAKCHGIVCTAKDQCHSVGTCDPGAGLCSNPNTADGTACSDGNACTKNDICTAGVCGGTAYTCNDGLACTADTCNGDGTCTFSVTAGNCLIGGACYASGAGSLTNQCLQCTPTTSQTAWSPKARGTSCNDGNACTANDMCNGAGQCGGTAYTCNDGLACTADSCNGDGTCTFALSPGNCLISGVCYAAGMADPAKQCQQCMPATSQTGWTAKANGTGCNDGDACTGNDKCTAGTCGGTAYSCDDGLACTTDACNGDGTCTHTTTAGNCLIGGACYPAGAASPINQCQQCTPTTSQTAWSAKANGTSCNDGNACTQTDTCSAGTCTGSNPVRCTASDQCHDTGTCDTGTGACSNPAKADGTTCDDGNAQSQGDVCTAGVCQGTIPCASVADVHAGTAHTCAVRTDGSLWCWGENELGQLGNGTTIDSQIPIRAGSATWNWTSVAAGGFHTCVIRRDGTLWCWGDNELGQLGNGTTDPASTPTQVAGQNWTAVQAGRMYTCGVQKNGTLWCWGDNQHGGLGNSTQSNSAVPVQVLGTDWASMAVGKWHTCGIKVDQTLWCWGWNADGELGNNSTQDSLTPVQIGNATWANVAAGGTHTCGVKLDGSLWCWGGNADGQLGTGSTASSLTPVQVGSAAWASASGGAAHTCGVQGDGTLWCWGDDDSGQVGDGMLVNRPVPVRIPGQAWARVSAGGGHTCGRRQDGSLWCWGSNSDGQIGDGTTVSQTAPEQVVGQLCGQVPICGNGQVEQGEQCDDGNNISGDGCTMDCQIEKCFAVVCKASDQCHDIGSCDPATGACSNPARVDGTNCNDGNACTQTDACLAGACAGGNPVQCTASDQCHSVGTCDPATGTCSNPAKVDGTSCNDGNACTQTDACLAGACTGGNSVQCAVSDQCHSVGTCDPATGTCSNPAKPAGAACDDGLFCNGPDTCDTAGACSVHSGPACTKTPCDETTRSCLGTGNIGPAGGQIAYPDGASADFPAQAVTAITAISISESQSGYPDLPAGAVLQGSVWEFEPHGATFAAAVTIRIPFTAGVAQPMLYTAEPGGTWQLVPGGATVDGNTLQASVTAFSYMAPLTMTGGTTPPGACIPAATFATSANFATLSGGLWSPMGVAVGDINGDGKPDLAVVENQYQSASKVAVFLNTTNPANGVPAFAARVDYDSGIDSRTDVALGDLDGDGKLDIVLGNEDGSFSALVNLTASGAAAPSFAAKAVFPGKASGNRSVAVADVNLDGKLDVVGLSRNNNMSQIWLNITAAGSGILAFSTPNTAYSGGGQPQSVAVADLNLDGKADIVISNADPLAAHGSFGALVNLTTSGSTSPSFQMSAFTAGNLPARVAVADFNADGLPDVAVANNKSGTISIYLNTGGAGATVASFGAMQVIELGSSASLALPTTIAAADLDGDGLPDLVVADGTANPSANRLEVFHNRTAAGSPTVSFSQPERLALSSASVGLAIADLTGDGKPEIIATTLNFGVSVFRNLASVYAGSSLSVKESQITDGTTSDMYPRLGADSQGLLVVYSVRPVTSSGYGPGSITYQRLTSDGVPTGSPVLVSSGGTNDQLDDVSGNYIVYTAFDSLSSLSGSIILYDIETATASVLAKSYAFREARIFGNNVAWGQGGVNAASVNLFDIRGLVTGAAPIVLAGPSPSALDPKLSDRFVVWDEMVSGQHDVYAYNLSTGAPTAVATSSTIEESLPATSGGWVVWVARNVGAVTSRIEAINLDTGEKRTIADNGALCNRPSIDGNFVVYESNVGGNYDIYVYRMDAQDTFQVTTNASDAIMSEVFGSLVTYIDTRSGNNGNYQVFVSSMSPCP